MIFAPFLTMKSFLVVVEPLPSLSANSQKPLNLSVESDEVKDCEGMNRS